MADGDPQAAVERRECARHLVQHPLTCAEHDPDLFRLIRRHEAELDRWFTQRLGYRLHIDADTARLHKGGYVPTRRPLRATSGRPFTPVEYTVLALVLAATASGPSVISLRDLVGEVRSAATEADVALPTDHRERRTLVTALKWMMEAGLATELHEHVEAFAEDASADAVLRLRPDRIALLSTSALVGASSASDLLDRATRRAASRQWMRQRLVEDPVVYRADLTEDEWSELRRRLGDEERLLDEMFGLTIEARAEGVAAIDPTGTLADRRFPIGGTRGHAALLLIERLREVGPLTNAQVLDAVADLASGPGKRWSKDLRDKPETLARQVIDLLVELRLATVVDDRVTLLPVAARFTLVATGDASPGGDGLGGGAGSPVVQDELFA